MFPMAKPWIFVAMISYKIIVMEYTASHKKTICISEKNGTSILSLQDIVRMEADSNYTKIYLKNSKSILVSKVLKSFEDQGERNGFLRIHRSHFINVAFIDEVIDNKLIRLFDGTTLNISRSRQKWVTEYFS